MRNRGSPQWWALNGSAMVGLIFKMWYCAMVGVNWILNYGGNYLENSGCNECQLICMVRASYRQSWG